jgi:hypothetical protein
MPPAAASARPTTFDRGAAASSGGAGTMSLAQAVQANVHSTMAQQPRPVDPSPTSQAGAQAVSGASRISPEGSSLGNAALAVVHVTKPDDAKGSGAAAQAGAGVAHVTAPPAFSAAVAASAAQLPR